jgi:hypothetical protein
MSLVLCGFWFIIHTDFTLIHEVTSVHFYKSLPFYFHYARHLQKLCVGLEKREGKKRERNVRAWNQLYICSRFHWVHYTASCGYSVLLCEHFITVPFGCCWSCWKCKVHMTYCTIIYSLFRLVSGPATTTAIHSALDNKKEWAFCIIKNDLNLMSPYQLRLPRPSADRRFGRARSS